MSTPETMGSILDRLRERLSDAERDAKESHSVAMNSYGAGYDRGFADAIRETISEIAGE